MVTIYLGDQRANVAAFLAEGYRLQHKIHWITLRIGEIVHIAPISSSTG
ncbi:hypothetical protein ATU3C_19770 [Agrobacterium genomosp. 3 str. RTP8]|nr:hypothetical protein [Agrobacterium tomkonis RTP8]